MRTLVRRVLELHAAFQASGTRLQPGAPVHLSEPCRLIPAEFTGLAGFYIMSDQRKYGGCGAPYK